MAQFPLPVSTSRPEHPHESSGRLINCYARKLMGTAGTQITIRRVPGMTSFATSSNTGFRGMRQVGANLYSAWASSSGKVYKSTSAGGAMAALTGNLPGTVDAIFAANNAATPDVVAVVPGEGAFSISTTTVSAFADADVSTPSSVCFHKGFFIFGYGDAKMRSTGVNNVSVATTDVATAEYKRDTLYRVISYKGQLLAFGSESLEFWGGLNDVGFPFSFITAADVGIVGPYAVTGDQDGFDAGLYFGASDFSVRRVNGYTSDRISTPDLERLIAGLADKTTLKLSSYISDGHPVVVVSSASFTWEYSVTAETWNERASYDDVCWRGLGPAKAFDKWMCGDSESGNIYEIDSSEHEEAGSPLRARIETGPLGNFPEPIDVERVELYITKGIGIAAGEDPNQTNPMIEISLSPDGGHTWKTPRQARLGRQSIFNGRVGANNLGHCISQGARLRFDIADAVPFGLMGGDMISSVLG